MYDGKYLKQILKGLKYIHIWVHLTKKTLQLML